MKTRPLAGLLLVALVAAAILSPAGSAVAAKKKKKPKPPPGPVVVATDAADDWGLEGDATLQPLGDALGQELVSATIDMADPATVNFILTLNSLPSNGGAPEVSRYVWDMMINGTEFIELDGKWSNYTRGACDPTSGQCPPPRDPGMQPFVVRGDCTTDTNTNVTTCQEIGLVQATFDTAKKTITIPVPLELLGAQSGSVISGGTNLFGGSISANPSAFFSSDGAPFDAMTQMVPFTIP